MIKLYSLSALFIMAGLIHLVSPEVFLPVLPEFLPWKVETILITGIYELILALFLLIEKSREKAARASAVYLIALLPVHLYVSIEQKEIFGFSSPLLLWGRTLFQFVLIYLFLSLQKNGALIHQRWRDVIFLHYKVPARSIQHLVPFPLDLYEGNAVISIVPFMMDRIRFTYFPWIPKVSQLWELNLRTYVIVNGEPGVYFFTLETDSRIGTCLARSLFYLPYEFARISVKKMQNFLSLQYQRTNFELELDIDWEEKPLRTEFTTWASERYHLFLKHKTSVYKGTVKHEPWRLQQATLRHHKDFFTSMLGDVGEKEFVTSTYSKELNVSFSPFQRM